MQASAPVPGGNSTRFGQGDLAHLAAPHFVNTMKDCTVLATRLSQSGIATRHRQCQTQRKLPWVSRTLSRLIAMLSSLKRPLTRRLICPHRSSISGLAVPSVKARHWPKTLTMPPGSPTDYASFFSLPTISLPSSHQRFSADPGKHSASQARHGLVRLFSGLKQPANEHVTGRLGAPWFLSTPRYLAWSCTVA
jgi:hypothetical protein